MRQVHPDHRTRGPNRLLAATLSALALAAAGCAGQDAGSSQAAGPGRISFTSCGQTITLDRAPQRVVITNDAIADALFALGVGDRIVAKTRGESAPSPALKARLESLPNLGVRNPSTEALIAAKPDLLITDQLDKVSGSNGGPTVDELKQLGVATFVVGGDCVRDIAEDSAGLDALDADLDQFGKVFEVQTAARALADQLRARLDDTRRRTAQQPKVGIVEVAQVAGQLYVTTGGLSNDVMQRAGGKNLFGELPGQFTPISPEQIIARNPQAIIIDDFTASADGQRDSIAYLTRTFPTTDAVKQQRILAIDAARTGARGSTRPVDGVVELARFLHPNAFPAQ
ncbi:ABC transporter substrate-binding protein [Actinosynnema sp. ALI-1.44]|uniref:ABC transporter substrate-binding protein n=1 Tax=Actinosynnema sp. ALI-1.44 TaxID=1933779 RepID=UPI00097CA6BE|nr:ABC transporter substrate-binding protein [Actinosynnema sp. ALI-1.44]ONI78052.1 ABC transporter substrate-binding protein [Actinosynnema sp. ALI-1.44]